MDEAGCGCSARISQIEKDLYYGNGRPALTARIQRVEDATLHLWEGHDRLSRNISGIRADMRKVVWLVLAAVVLAVLKLVLVKG